MPKEEKVYVIIENGVINENVYTSLSAVSKEIKVPARTLWRWLGGKGEYSKGAYLVKVCYISRIVGRGRF